LETLRDKFGVTRSHTVYGNEFNIGLNWQQEHRIPDGGLRETNQALVLDWRWMQRAVDDPLMPMSGSLTEFRLGGAGKVAFSDEDFVRTYLRRQQWIRLGESDVITLRGETGYTKSPTRVNVPQEYLFRVGGTQTVRGYAYQSLGVHEDSAVVGGRAMVAASAEYTHWFSSLGVAAFADAGDAADSIDALKPVIGYGFGARWRSPVGPLALDVARSKTVSDLVYHFSIAVAF
jgi:translocation and assembly module TamA